MFPGQGSQYVGMGKEFYDNRPECKAVYDLASEVTGLDVAALCFEENDKLNITEYTQICMLTTEAAIYAALKEEGITCEVTAGLSLGEYGALIASGAMSMKDAFAVVRKRGIYMQEAYPTGGAMSAILGLDAEVIAQTCEKTQNELRSAGNAAAVVSVANYNCPGQIVITGTEDAVSVAGDALKDVTIGAITTPYLANVNADYVTDPAAVKDLLVRQVSSSVHWQQTIERLIADGADEFVEIGPGRSLSGFMRKINRDVTTCNIDKMEDFVNYVNR